MTRKKGLKQEARRLSVLMLIFYVLFTFLLGFYIQNGYELRPDYTHLDLLIYLKTPGSYENQQLVVFKEEVKGEEQLQAGWIAAAGAHQIKVEDGSLFIDGVRQVLPNSGLLELMDPLEFELGKDEVLIMAGSSEPGANRRLWKVIQKNQLAGRAIAAIKLSEL